MEEKRQIKKDKGITLVALIITVIIMLILAGIAINYAIGKNGLIGKVDIAKRQTQIANAKEKIELAIVGSYNKEGEIERNQFQEAIEKDGGSIVFQDENSIIVELEEYEAVVDIKTGQVKIEEIKQQYPKETLEISENIENMNTCAKVSNVENNVVTIDQETLKVSTITGKFEKDDKVMIYASNSSNVEEAGKFEMYTINAVENDEISLDKEVDTSKFNNSNCQILKVAKYRKIKIDNNAIVTPLKYDGKTGGIIALEAQEIIVNGKIDVSKCGYDFSNIAPNNGGRAADLSSVSWAGGSNKYKGGNGGRNYQGYIGYASGAVGKSGDIFSSNQMYMGGGSQEVKGGGIIYINCLKLEIGSQYALSANGQGGSVNINTGGGAGGTICVNANQITFSTNDKDYFAGANGRKWSNRV